MEAAALFFFFFLSLRPETGQGEWRECPKGLGGKAAGCAHWPFVLSGCCLPTGSHHPADGCKVLVSLWVLSVLSARSLGRCYEDSPETQYSCRLSEFMCFEGVVHFFYWIFKSHRQTWSLIFTSLKLGSYLTHSQGPGTPMIAHECVWSTFRTGLLFTALV